jgi:hypothetical protein
MDPVFVPTDWCWTVKGVVVVQTFVACAAAVSMTTRLPGGSAEALLLRLARFWIAAGFSCDDHPPPCVTTTDDDGLCDADPASSSFGDDGGDDGDDIRRRYYCCLCPGPAFSDYGTCCMYRRVALIPQYRMRSLAWMRSGVARVGWASDSHIASYIFVLVASIDDDGRCCIGVVR